MKSVPVRPRCAVLIVVAVASTSITVVAQQARQAADAPPALTAADYARAEKFMTYNTTPLVLHGGVRPTWLPQPSGDRFWYRTTTEKGAEVLMIDAATGARSACELPACLAAADENGGTGRAPSAARLMSGRPTASGPHLSATGISG